MPFAEHSRRALAATYAGRGLVVHASGVAADTAALLATLPDGPQPRHEVADLGELPAVLARNAPA